MNKKIYLILLFVFINLRGIVYPSPNSFNKNFIDASRSAKPCVVNIIIYQRSGTGHAARLQRSAFGSGTIISRDGFIVTNHHVLTKGNYYQVICSDGSQYGLEARLNIFNYPLVNVAHGVFTSGGLEVKFLQLFS